ncbi:uncharacterized protein CEXT_522211 [Caerostris extrusa]|uniref:Uncharacterized protein n=1 Tax=Caerostris extrusa TaxID=172846 RepID=A0AAV4WJI1_CAEEX|nr:uncharacterized protein CEXT_522211 [Caerostris extrusa]
MDTSNSQLYSLPLSQCPISTATLCNIPKHMVTTTQQDYYGRTIGSNTGNTFLEKSCPCHSAPKEKNPKPQTTSYHDAMEILTTVGPVPLVKRCRAVPQWETTYGRDFVYDPVLKPVFLSLISSGNEIHKFECICLIIKNG